MYLVEDVVQRVGAVDGEADKDQVRLRVGERAQAVVLLLPGRVPERQLDNLAAGAVDRVRDVVLKDGRDVFLPVALAGAALSATSTGTDK